MATIHLQPPTSFDFKDPNSWPRWKRRFEQFRQASCLAAEDDAKQISYLMYCMGEDAEETLTSTNISTDDRAKFDPRLMVTELRRFLGMVNQLGKFTPNIAEISQPLRELLSCRKTWLWGPVQNEAY